VSIGSFAGFNEGEQVNLGPRISYDVDATVTSSTSAYTPVFTVRNSFIFASRANQTVVKLMDLVGSAKGNANSHTKFYAIRNVGLTGPVNFQSAATGSSCYFDTTATGLGTFNRNQIIWSGSVVESDYIDHTFVDREITLQPGESVTVCVRSIAATAACTATLNTREDQ
jgi:hypothetical protein